MKPALHSPSVKNGFTLIETVLAVGIVAFTFVGIAGLLPCGMQTFRRAMDNTMQAQMTQNIVAQASQVPFSNLSQFDGRDMIFDDNGDLVDSTNPQRAYRARVQITSQVDVPASSAFANPGLAQLTITYYRPSAPASSSPLGQTVTYIANKAGDLAE